MKIAYFYPPQIVVSKDLIFTQHLPDITFFNQACDPTADLIYAASISVLPQAVTAKQTYNKPLVCWCWDIPYNWRDWDMSEVGMQENAGRDAKNLQSIELLKQCDMVISASKWTQSVLKNKFNISSEQIYFYIDTHGIDAVPAQKRRDQIIQISRYFYNKKFEHSIEAIKALPDYELILIGVGLNSQYGQTLFHNANTQVKFYEALPRNSVIDELKKSRILVSPSVFEGWPFTPVEALYCEVPVLLSDLPICKEVYGNNVWYHKRNDIKDMAEKLFSLASDPTSQRIIVQDCKPIIAEFTPEKFAKRWINLIK